MKTTVWISRIMTDSTLIKGFGSDVLFADQAYAVDAMKRNESGEPLPAERFPTEMYGKYPDKKYAKLPDICKPGGFWTVSAACAEVLRGCNLGQSSLYPVKIFQHDRKTPVEGEYYCLNFGERKAAFLPEESPRVHKPYPTRDLWKLWPNVRDDDVAVSTAALNGPDLWVDPKLWMGVFLSDRLVEVLKAAKVARRWGLYRCRVI